MNRSTDNTTAKPAAPRLTSLSHGGGCGCKIAPGVLSEILKSTTAMPIPARRRRMQTYRTGLPGPPCRPSIC